jgi:hypothetical protein
MVKHPVANRLKTALCILFFASLAVEPLAALLGMSRPLLKKRR